MHEWRTLIDRKLERNFSNKKILAISGVQSELLHTLTSGLVEAWQESDQERFKMAKGYRGLSKFDALTDSYIDLKYIADNEKQAFISCRNVDLLNTDANLNGYPVEIPNQYWLTVENTESQISFKRIGYSVKGEPKDLRWLNFRFPQIVNSTGFSISFKVTVNKDVKFKPFIHYFGENIKLFDVIEVEKNQTILVSLNIQPDDKIYKHISITATDFPMMNTTVKIEQLKVSNTDFFNN